MAAYACSASFCIDDDAVSAGSCGDGDGEPDAVFAVAPAASEASISTSCVLSSCSSHACVGDVRTGVEAPSDAHVMGEAEAECGGEADMVAAEQGERGRRGASGGVPVIGSGGGWKGTGRAMGK